jgi:hypothetical protein
MNNVCGAISAFLFLSLSPRVAPLYHSPPRPCASARATRRRSEGLCEGPSAAPFAL